MIALSTLKDVELISLFAMYYNATAPMLFASTDVR